MLKDCYAVITGCNRGIGKAILENFVQNGANIYAVVRKKEKEFEEEAKQLEQKYKVDITIYEADFRKEEQVLECAKNILKDKKQIDILVNNIGVALPLNSVMMTKIETIKEVFEINFFSQLLFTQKIARNMMKKGGSIIFVSSSAAFDGGANVEYSASKAAINGEVRRLAMEFGRHHIRVNAVAPGLTDTDMANSLEKKDQEIALGMNIMGRKGKPEEIANVVTFLASNHSSFMTAQVLRVDGGLR